MPPCFCGLAEAHGGAAGWLPLQVDIQMTTKQHKLRPHLDIVPCPYGNTWVLAAALQRGGLWGGQAASAHPCRAHGPQRGPGPTEAHAPQLRPLGWLCRPARRFLQPVALLLFKSKAARRPVKPAAQQPCAGWVMQRMGQLPQPPTLAATSTATTRQCAPPCSTRRGWRPSCTTTAAPTASARR
jgi:hypothetical protein